LDTLVYIIFLVLEKTVPLMPLGFWYFCVWIYSNMFYYLIPIRKKTALSNLRLAFPEKSEAEIHRIVKGVYKNVFTVIFELFYMRKMDDRTLSRFFKFANIEVFHRALARGKGTVIISAHFGNWEVMAYGGARVLKHRFNVIVKEQSNLRLDKGINRIRSSAGNRMIEMRNSLREVLKLLRENELVAMLADQSAPKEGSIRVKFFVPDVPVFEGAAKFALKTGASVIFCVSVRNPDHSYSIELEEIDTSEYGPYGEESIRKLTEAHAALLEQAIRKNPDHWLWFHRRFKHVT
jgi:Kdo2-lipid IVA lauroyltransferase/acyltransferase